MTDPGTRLARDPSAASTGTGRRRRWLLLAIGLVVVAIVVGLAVGWYVFFGTEAPPAPSLDDALRVLVPSPAPASPAPA